MERRHGRPEIATPARSSTLFAGPGGGLAGELLDLQHSAGNAAVSSLLDGVQRQELDEAAPAEELDLPLTPEEVADALSYYRAQPGRYTADIVSQIQAAVDVPETGAIDAATVQAVARWQRDEGSHDPPLVVDGKAGPRTLPRIFASGLNAPGVGQEFGEAAQTGVIDRWGELTPRERGAELVRLVNEHLEAAGVPPVIPNVQDEGNAAGSFDFETWQMNIGIEALEDEQLTRDEAADIIDTIYHESRHAEQWFRMAQMRAGRGRTAAQIEFEMSIQADAATSAVTDPLELGSMEALIAQGWFDSVYGSGSAHREATLTELDRAATALDEAQQRFDDDPTPANQAALDAAQARFDEAFAQYRELPEENDAWATGPMVQPGVTRGSPEPEEPSATTEPESSDAEPAQPEPTEVGGVEAGAEPAGEEIGEPTGELPESGETELGPLAEELAALLAALSGGVPADAEPEPAP